MAREARIVLPDVAHHGRSGYCPQFSPQEYSLLLSTKHGNDVNEPLWLNDTYCVMTITSKSGYCQYLLDAVRMKTFVALDRIISMGTKEDNFLVKTQDSGYAIRDLSALKEVPTEELFDIAKN